MATLSIMKPLPITTKHDQSVEPAGSFLRGLQHIPSTSVPLPVPTTGTRPTTQALNVLGLLHHVNTCNPVVQQLKLLLPT